MTFARRSLTREQIFYLLQTYGSPLYVYDEETLRLRCQEMKNLVDAENFEVHFSAKANTNVELLKIIRTEGLKVDAISPGEIYLEELAGFTSDDIMFVSNNISAAEMKQVANKDIYISLDSLNQLDTWGQINPGSEVCLRINTGIGAGFDDKVITAGEHTKFGIDPDELDEARAVADRYNLKITGLNHHVGSLFLEGTEFLAAAERLLQIAAGFTGLRLIDLGGGFGIPYAKNSESRLDLQQLGARLSKIFSDWVDSHYPVRLVIEPGRYIVAESGVLLATVTSIKKTKQHKYIGCDAGFNTLIRPAFYGSYHEVEIAARDPSSSSAATEKVTLVGPICESGDVLASERLLPACRKQDAVIIYDTGAYGYAMSSTYNSRPRPAEVLIDQQGEVRLIRPAERLTDLYR